MPNMGNSAAIPHVPSIRKYFPFPWDLGLAQHKPNTSKIEYMDRK